MYVTKPTLLLFQDDIYFSSSRQLTSGGQKTNHKPQIYNAANQDSRFIYKIPRIVLMGSHGAPNSQNLLKTGRQRSGSFGNKRPLPAKTGTNKISGLALKGNKKS